ncbi:Uncharacterized protein SCG7086_AS_00120 [Chlamydiales bacterium SCGC AG-110-P3]|nr:Uncharacterized protein SCG7086_AS_00120 [Chlamydiales bacterium SCGC AG-110-P3]
MPTPLRPSLYSATVDHRPPLTRLFEAWVLRSWWVILFCLACYAAYERTSLVFNKENNRLTTHLELLQHRRDTLTKSQLDLREQVNSQADPAWIEQTLIKVLGLAPEECDKIFFTDAQDTPQKNDQHR